MTKFDLQVFCTGWCRDHKDIRFYLSANETGDPYSVMVNCNKQLYGEAIYNTHYVHLTSNVADRSGGVMKVSSPHRMSLSGIIEFDIISQSENYDPKNVADTLRWIASVINPAVITSSAPAAK